MKREFVVLAAEKPARAGEPSTSVLVGIPKGELPCELTHRVKQAIPNASVTFVETVEQIRVAAKERPPEIIIVDDRILSFATLAESIGELAAVAPVVLIAAYERHAAIERMVVGQTDFVPRAADWESLAASLIERRLRPQEAEGRPVDSGTNGLGHDIAEIFRHEINNPLTGILGNAELLLAHSERFPPAETQRIRTVVELAVRLRETVRKVSDRWSKGVAPESKCDLAEE